MGVRDRFRSMRSHASSSDPPPYDAAPDPPSYDPTPRFVELGHRKDERYSFKEPEKNRSPKLNTGPQSNSRPMARPCCHKDRTSCQLSAALCCACLDKRPARTSGYPIYVDGVGQTDRGTRWQHYCSKCSAYWERRRNSRDRLEGPIIQPALTYLQLSLSQAGHTYNLDIPTQDPETLRINVVRKEAARMLDVRHPKLDIVDPSRLRLYLQGEELSDDTMTVYDAGMGFADINKLWYTVDQEEQMLDKLGKLKKEVVTLEERLVTLKDQMVDIESARMGEATTPSPLRTCVTCTDSLPTTAFPTTTPTPRCTHTPQVCLRDLDHWILAELSAKGPDRIGCPECGSLLQHSDIAALGSSATLQKFETQQTIALLSHDPDFRWCLSGAACGSGQIHSTGRDGPIMTCFVCGFKQCIIHERAWHEGETCGEFDERIKASKMKGVDVATRKLLDKTTKTCPGRPGQPCGWKIEKAEGCDHMTCSRCGGEFCYVCLAFYGAIREYGNSMHDPSCRYHSDHIK